jgi:hypothetical protein
MQAKKKPITGDGQRLHTAILLRYSGEKGCLKISRLISNMRNILFIAPAIVFKNPLISLKLIIFCRLFCPLHRAIQYEK